MKAAVPGWSTAHDQPDVEEVGLVGVDAEMVKLNLRLGPREGDGALESG